MHKFTTTKKERKVRTCKILPSSKCKTSRIVSDWMNAVRQKDHLRINTSIKDEYLWKLITKIILASTYLTEAQSYIMPTDNSNWTLISHTLGRLEDCCSTGCLLLPLTNKQKNLTATLTIVCSVSGLYKVSPHHKRSVYLYHHHHLILKTHIYCMFV